MRVMNYEVFMTIQQESSVSVLAIQLPVWPFRFPSKRRNCYTLVLTGRGCVAETETLQENATVASKLRLTL